MVCSSRKTAGVTLIELLVVMTIMISALALVGGMTIGSVARAQAQIEVISLYSLVKKSSVKAFSSGRSVILSFASSNIDIRVDGRASVIKKFNHLTFDDQVIHFNRNGLPDSLVVLIAVGGKKRSLDLVPLFDNFVLDDGRLGSDFE
tara:strand:- start:244 stop:684 length:441 start_codon:yes stop_codon:yes gene_type:complete